MTDLVLDLPPPPPANLLRRIDWRNHAKRVAWERTCDGLLMAAGGVARFRNDRKLPSVTGRFAIDILMDRKAKFDLDATLKAVLDYCVRVELVPDDSQKYLDDVHLHWGSCPEGMRVTIRPLRTGDPT